MTAKLWKKNIPYIFRLILGKNTKCRASKKILKKVKKTRKKGLTKGEMFGIIAKHSQKRPRPEARGFTKRGFEKKFQKSEKSS